MAVPGYIEMFTSGKIHSADEIGRFNLLNSAGVEGEVQWIVNLVASVYSDKHCINSSGSYLSELQIYKGSSV